MRERGITRPSIILLVLLCASHGLSPKQMQAQQFEKISSRFVAQNTDQGQIGFCRKCKHPEDAACDQAAREKAKKDWNEYVHKWNTAQELFDQAAKDMKQSADNFHKWTRDEEKALVEITVVKTSMLKAIEKAMSQAGAKVLGGAAALFGALTTYLWIKTDVYPEVRDHNQEMKDAGKEVEAGVKLAQEAIAAMKRALAAEKACKDQWAKDDAERAKREALVDKAKQLRDTWALDGSPLYKENPNDPNEYPMDAGAALHRAIDILSKKSGAAGGSANLPRYFRPHLQPVMWRVAFTLLHPEDQAAPGASHSQETYTLDQANAALAQVKIAETMMQDGHTLTQKQFAFENSWRGQLATVVAQWKESPPQSR